MRIKSENERIREWEIKFDEEQKKKEEEILKKFRDADLAKEKSNPIELTKDKLKDD